MTSTARREISPAPINIPAKQLLHVAVRQIPVSQFGEFIKLALDDSPTKRYGPKVQLAAELVKWCVTLFESWFRKRVMVVADYAYAKRPFLKRVMATGAVVVSRRRKDAALFVTQQLRNMLQGDVRVSTAGINSRWHIAADIDKAG